MMRDRYFWQNGLARRWGALCVILFGAWGGEAAAEVHVWVEAGAVWQSRNDVQIPADTGTRFSLTDFGAGPAFGPRVYLGYRFGERHSVRALWAPLSLNLSGTPDRTIRFQSEIFSQGARLEALYRFNSYRLTYRYEFIRGENWTVGGGVTAKVRDAEIRLTQGGTEAARTDVGLVPLLHLRAKYEGGARWGGLLDIEALAAPQGRAEDIALLATYRVDEDYELRAGYRTVEGGSEGGGDVYTFAWLHYAVVGLALGL